MSRMAFMAQKLLYPNEVQWKWAKIPTLKAYYVFDGVSVRAFLPFRFFINVY